MHCLHNSKCKRKYMLLHHPSIVRVGYNIVSLSVYLSGPVQSTCWMDSPNPYGQIFMVARGCILILFGYPLTFSLAPTRSQNVCLAWNVPTNT